jgi:hypothetical protein
MKYQNSLKILVLLISLAFASCSNNSNGQSRTNAPNVGATEINTAIPVNKTASELSGIIQKSIDYSKLQNYYHITTNPERKPLYILRNKIVPEKLDLTKFEQPVEFATCDELTKSKKPYIEFTNAEITPETAKIIFRYYIEGIEVTLDFAKEKDVWKLTKDQLVEKSFRDKSCESE